MIKCIKSWSFVHGECKRFIIRGEEKDVLDEYSIITSRLIKSGIDENDVIHSAAVGVCLGREEENKHV